MKLRSLLPRLLSILAVLGLLTAPIAVPSAAAMTAVETMTTAEPMAAMEDMPAMEAMAGMTDGMPCCPEQKQSLPDCQKACPLAILCLAKCFPNAPVVGASTPAIPMPVAVLVPSNDAARDPWAEPPPPRPPRT
ncbi:hypothetical protein K32_08950 [Kaistia sp. 32K]|uniref:hypothetical protein n=1 Tax=Kaistia sp. 32K TaxID=2795690 RepID=UPI001915C881|nr:hypothetical protein [Kaistia sp. 32K]BCP52278.1 hypothetical protein K32_08950 [Kaistia sp. 32K]